MIKTCTFKKKKCQLYNQINGKWNNTVTIDLPFQTGLCEFLENLIRFCHVLFPYGGVINSSRYFDGK